MGRKGEEGREEGRRGEERGGKNRRVMEETLKHARHGRRMIDECDREDSGGPEVREGESR